MYDKFLLFNDQLESDDNGKSNIKTQYIFVKNDKLKKPNLSVRQFANNLLI